MRNITPNYPPDLLQPMNPEIFQAEVQRYDSACHFAHVQRKKYEDQKNPALVHLRAISAAVSLHERQSKSIGAASMNADFYYGGGIIGLSVMELEKGSDFVSELFSGLDAVTISNFEHIDEAERLNTITEAIAAVSDYGLDLAGPYQTIIGHMGKLLCYPERGGRLFVERGFGMTAFMAGGLTMRNLEIEGEMKKLDLALGAGDFGSVDWDAGWAELGGTE